MVTHSKPIRDTEVLLAAFAEWKDECLVKLNGMFAFAIWDNEERTLTLARDHVGIKPLYYTSSSHLLHSAFVFSKSNPFLQLVLLSRGWTRRALHQFLTFLWAPDPNTLFAGVKTVPPGHVLKLKDDQLKLTQWWDVSFEAIEEGRDEVWWQQRVLETLDRVVKMEMVSDVPLGAFLSGGLDSSGIVAMMQRHSNGRAIDTYTVGIETIRSTLRHHSR